MGEIVNLRRAKKTKVREETQKRAEANRAKHGTPKPVRDAAASEKTRAARAADAHRLDKNDGN
ncbi:MAG: DUF4169 family protein [Rhizomicrobium sp.]